ncbi:tetratricopeptide repeat protein [Enterovirga sp.]|uniref:tetratricopeptide repeat protein n=1 Tax=Enterovirga sp. TaxID=2026350 RepID=UPI002B6A36B6|nr:tetratricopeptide repeat protein [Enterovirga sp.]HMO31086.1 tetratricopeptide repeat protein [Enterovirga sp.]
MRKLPGARPAFALLFLAGAAWPALAAPKKHAPEKPASKPAAAPAKPAPKPDLAYGAYQRGLYVTAFREADARLRADPSDAAAMTLIGELYSQGLGVKQDPADAAAWYRLAAARGSAHAMAALGMMSIEGRGMPRDARAAREWLEKAAAKKEPLASYNLALVLLDRGSDEDIARAGKLLAVAAEAEIADAQHSLGVMYARGLGGLAQDKAAAARLYMRAAYNGSMAGEVEYAIALFNGEGVPKDERLAVRHFLHAAARGNAIAQNRTARLYVLGRGVGRNLVEALAWHLMAKKQGLADPWLDEQLKDVSAADRATAARRAEDRANL